MTAISNVATSPAEVTPTSSSSRLGSSSRSANLGQILKAVGVLALALSGGAQARPMDSFSHSRNLNHDTDDDIAPYGYKSLCDSGIVDHYVKGMSYDGCMAEENAVIDDLKDSKPLDTLKRCYTGSGSLSAALTGVSLASLIGGTSVGLAISATSISLALVALLPTTICGGVFATINRRIDNSRREAEECCEHLPKQAVVDANAANAAAKNAANATTTANGTSSANPPASSNTSMALVPETGSSSNSTTVVSTLTTLNNSLISNTTITNTTITHQRNL